MATNWAKIGKWAAILTPIAVVGGWYYVKTQKTKALKLGEPQKIPTNPTIVTPSNNNKFPLKVGVKNNDYVKILQAALGVGVDGNFGTKETLPALKLKANKSEIKDLADLNNTIVTIKSYNQSNSSISKNRADKILELLYGTQLGDTLIGGDHRYYALNKTISLQEIAYDNINDVWVTTGTIKNLAKGGKYSKDVLPLMKGDDFNGDNIIDLVMYNTSDNTYFTIPAENIDVL
jgi:hypothetical protein